MIMKILYSYIRTHIKKNSCDIHTTGGQLLQGVDIIILSYFSYLKLLPLQ